MANPLRLYPGISVAGIDNPHIESALRAVDQFLRDVGPAVKSINDIVSVLVGGGAPANVSFATVLDEHALVANARQLAATAPITLADGGAGTQISIGAALGVPTITLGLVAAAGSAGTLIRSDATIAAFDATLPSALSGAAATGSAAFAARRDHVHEVTAIKDSGATFVTFGVLAAAGAVISNGTSLSVQPNLALGNGGTGAGTALGAFDNLSPMTTKGDLVTRDTSHNARLGVGANGQVLTADSAQTLGIKWAALPADATTFVDNTFQIFDNFDNTRIGMFQMSGISTGNTRTLSFPDFDGKISTTPTITEQDFGSTPVNYGEWTISDGKVTASSHINVWLTAEDGDEADMEPMACFAENIAAGSFLLVAVPFDGPVTGLFKFAYQLG